MMGEKKMAEISIERANGVYVKFGHTRGGLALKGVVTKISGLNIKMGQAYLQEGIWDFYFF